MKPYCAYCWLPLALDPIRYEQDGNMCWKCSSRCTQVIAGNKTTKEADRDLRFERNKNIRIYKHINER